MRLLKSGNILMFRKELLTDKGDVMSPCFVHRGDLF